MSRKKTEINPVRADRVKILMEREKITQTVLAERIFQTQQNISRIMQKRQPLTEETARLIIKAFPEYRLEWLLGYDNAMRLEDCSARKAQTRWFDLDDELAEKRTRSWRKNTAEKT